MAEKIIKIGVNSVEYTKSSTVIDISGVDFEVWDKTENYEQDILTRESTLAAQLLLDAQNFDEKVYKDQLIADAQARVDKLAAIQIEMDK